MAREKLRRLVGRPLSSESSEVTGTILEAASRVFVARGFAATTMRMIAVEAQVSPQTLYARFPDKTKLYVALMTTRTDHLLAAMSLLLKDDTPPAVFLQRFGEQLIATFLGADLQQLHQRVIESAESFPILANNFFEQGPNRGQKLLEVYLCRQVEKKRLKISEVEIAAEQFIGSLVGGVVIRSTLRQKRIIGSKKELQAWVQQAVNAFVRAYSIPG